MWSELISYLIGEIRNKNPKGIIWIIGMIILTLLFISPAYIFIFFYKRSLLYENNLIISTITVLVLNLMLFLVLFLIVSLRDIEYTPKGFKDSGKLYKDIIRAISFMGGVSMSLMIVQCIRIIMKGDSNVIIGLYTILGAITIIFCYYFINFIVEIRKARDKKDD